MKKILFLVTILSFISINTHAEISANISIEENRYKTTIKKDKVTLYNFSDALIDAASNCFPYQEDFTINNPSLKNLGKIFGNADFQVLIDIKGFNNDKCEFTVTQKFLGMNNTENNCSVDKEMQEQIIKAMKNKSTKLMTETFITKPKTMNIYGEIINTGEAENTMTDGIFNITLSKVLGNYCISKYVEPTEEEKKSAKEKMLQFSDNFISSLQSCSPNKEEISMMFLKLNAEIIGKKDYKCQLRTENFDFYIPKENLKEITDFEKLYSLVTDENIAKYRALENYSLSSIYKNIKDCGQNKIGRGHYSSSYGDIYKVEKSISSEFKNNECSLKILNKITIKDKTTNYSIQCDISDTEKNNIISLFASEEDKDEYIRGKNILKYLVKNKLCKYATDK